MVEELHKKINSLELKFQKTKLSRDGVIQTQKFDKNKFINKLIQQDN